MKIAILSSMSFKKKIIEYKNILESHGHIVGMPHETANLRHSKKAHDRLKKKLDLITANYTYVNNHDAVFVLNLTKAGIKNYIGPNSFIEMVFAHILKKKIFVLNPIPKMIYSDEIESIKPIVINGDLAKIL